MPRPGPRAATRPSITRSRESFSGSSLRDGKAGWTRIEPGAVVAALAGAEPERAEGTDGHAHRSAVAAAGREQLLVERAPLAGWDAWR